MNAFLPGNLSQYLGAMRGLYGNPGQPQTGGAMMPGGLPLSDGGSGHAGFGQAFQPRDPLATAGGLPPQQPGFPMQTGGPGQVQQQFPGWLTGGGQQPQQMGNPWQTGGGQPPATASSFQQPEENDPFGGYRGNFGRGMLR